MTEHGERIAKRFNELLNVRNAFGTSLPVTLSMLSEIAIIINFEEFNGVDIIIDTNAVKAKVRKG